MTNTSATAESTEVTSRRPHPTETKPLERSAFYQLKSRRTLATLLGISLPQLELLARDADSLYTRRLAKKRSVQVPKGALRRVHVRIFELLRRIETPDYLHSGIRSRSYVTNAASHATGSWIGKLDIKSFFPSVKRPAIFRFFRDRMHCSPDVADRLASLCTCDGVVPTGSPISQSLAFWAHEHDFSTIARHASQRGLRMTLYVDDIGLSGPSGVRSMLRFAEKCLERRGLQAHKVRLVRPGRTIVLTGVAIIPKGLRLPNRRRVALARDLQALRTLPSEPGETQSELLKTVVGRCYEAAQFEPKYARLARRIAAKSSATAVCKPHSERI